MQIEQRINQVNGNNKLFKYPLFTKKTDICNGTYSGAYISVYYPIQQQDAGTYSFWLDASYVGTVVVSCGHGGNTVSTNFKYIVSLYTDSTKSTAYVSPLNLIVNLGQAQLYIYTGKSSGTIEMNSAPSSSCPVTIGDIAVCTIDSSNWTWEVTQTVNGATTTTSQTGSAIHCSISTESNTGIVYARADLTSGHLGVEKGTTEKYYTSEEGQLCQGCNNGDSACTSCDASTFYGCDTCVSCDSCFDICNSGDTCSTCYKSWYACDNNQGYICNQIETKSKEHEETSPVTCSVCISCQSCQGVCQAKNVSCTTCVSGLALEGKTVTISCKSSDESICTSCNFLCDGCNTGCYYCNSGNGCETRNTETCLMSCYGTSNGWGENCDGSKCNSANMPQTCLTIDSCEFCETTQTYCTGCNYQYFHCLFLDTIFVGCVKCQDNNDNTYYNCDVCDANNSNCVTCNYWYVTPGTCQTCYGTQYYEQCANMQSESSICKYCDTGSNTGCYSGNGGHGTCVAQNTNASYCGACNIQCQGAQSKECGAGEGCSATGYSINACGNCGNQGTYCDTCNNGESCTQCHGGTVACDMCYGCDTGDSTCTGCNANNCSPCDTCQGGNTCTGCNSGDSTCTGCNGSCEVCQGCDGCYGCQGCNTCHSGNTCSGYYCSGGNSSCSSNHGTCSGMYTCDSSYCLQAYCTTQFCLSGYCVTCYGTCDNDYS